MDDKETYVKGELSHFLRIHSAEASISAIDEIVLSYMVSILEDLGSQSAAEAAFDPEEFTEMMEAYLPGFADINSMEVSEWMFTLSAKLDKARRAANGEDKAEGELSLKMPEPELERSPDSRQTKRTHSTSEKESEALEKVKIISDPVQNGGGVSDEGEITEDMDLLSEMFPSACTLEITHCLCLSNGDMEKAAQLILHRQETGDCIKNSHRVENFSKINGSKPVNERKLKENLLNKYSYVDTDDDKREHRPVAPKREPKKLVRYLDNKVVSTKGERFTEVKRDEGDDMKKTYVNLKPAKQYRFH